jgi:hypothetical protein
MTRKIVATAVAVIVSIPLIPLLVTTTERLAGTDVAMVFPAESWRAEGRPLGTARGVSESDWTAGFKRGVADQERFYVYQDQDSGFGHGFPAGLFSAGNLDAGCIDDPAAKTGRCYPWPSILTNADGLPFERVGMAATGWGVLADSMASPLSPDVGSPRASDGCVSGGQTTQCGLHDAYGSGDMAYLNNACDCSGDVFLLSHRYGNQYPDGTTMDWLGPAQYVGAAFTTVPQVPTFQGPDAYNPLSTANGFVWEFADRSADAADLSYHTVGPGWFSLDLPNNGLAVHGQIELEFVSNDGERRRVTLERSGILGGQRAAWIHFSEPGSLAVRASGGEPALRAVGYSELIGRSRDITLAKAELTVFLLCEMLPIVAWILTVCFLRSLAYWAICRLPRPVRVRATDEVDLMFTIAKWAGVSCYLVWTVKDVLSGVGVAFGM